MNTISRKTA